jgi:glycosyltransferase involved in cell wall biosynthesis
MRIVLAAHQTRGGISTLARGLAQFLPGALAPTDRLHVAAGWNNRRLRESRIGRFAFEQLCLPALSRRSDLLHLCDHRAVFARRGPFLLTVHDVFFLEEPAWYPPRVAQYKRLMLDAALARRPAIVVCVSEWTRERLLERRPRIDRSRLAVVPSGISNPPAGTSHSPDLDRPYFLTVSTIEPRKNYLRLLVAFRAARAAGLELRWRIVGGPGYAAEPIVNELRNEPGVELCGRVTEEEKERLYGGALFAVTPALAEGFGFPPLEAMVRGVPVVCSSGSALDEVVGDAALRVGPSDERGWTETLLRLAADTEERGRLGRAGLQRAQLFSWEQCAAGYVRVYHRALEA